jgi:hypothetical protein
LVFSGNVARGHSGDAGLPPLKAGQLAIPDEIPVIKALQGFGRAPAIGEQLGVNERGRGLPPVHLLDGERGA